jgi:Mg-chelatase subunit ChlD
MKTNIYNLIILDESGSMDSIKQAALGGLNETLQTIRNAQTKFADCQHHFVSLVSFNGTGVKRIFDLATTDNIRELASSDYLPNDNTPLYDAMGNGISRLRSQIDSAVPHDVLVTIITDGYENASREFSGKMIKNLVQEMKAKEWTFVYIGANQDVDAVADSISVDNRIDYQASDSGIRFMLCRENSARENWYKKVADKSKGEEIDVSKGFFDGLFDDEEG